MARRLSILLLLVLALTIAPLSTAKSRGKPRKSEGTYTLKVAGYVRGQGKAQVKPGQEVRLSLAVMLESGSKAGTVDVTMKPLPNSTIRYAGDSTILGRAAHFEARLDVPDDDKEQAIRGVRLVCRIRNEDLKYASVVGYVPELANASSGDDDDDQGNNGNRGKDKPRRR